VNTVSYKSLIGISPESQIWSNEHLGRHILQSVCSSFFQIYVLDAVPDKDELFRFWGHTSTWIS